MAIEILVVEVTLPFVSHESNIESMYLDRYKYFKYTFSYLNHDSFELDFFQWWYEMKRSMIKTKLI